MSKAMKIQVLAFEDKNEVDILISGLNRIISYDTGDYESGSDIKRAKDIRNELIKISKIFKATNNN
tara:strand:- start:152 stop:349 length:198 start_codon:yes stop_codon:yes gene_type:complete